MSDWRREYKRTIDEETKKLFEKFFNESYDDYNQTIKELLEGFDVLDIHMNREYPNMFVTGNNKMVEILHEFKDKGISIFALYDEKEDKVQANIVGTAIIEDVKSRAIEGYELTAILISILTGICNRLAKTTKEINEMSALQTMKLNIANLLVPGIAEPLLGPTKGELDRIDQQLVEYMEKDEQLFKYDYKKELVPAIADLLEEMDGTTREYEYYGYPDKIIPVLKKLELEDLIPELKAELAKREIPISILYPKQDPNKEQAKKPMQQVDVSVTVSKQNINDGDIDY